LNWPLPTASTSTSPNAQGPWQRGANENFNGLLRQYFPKGTDLSIHSHAHVAHVMEELNTRPRKLLGYRTPKQALHAEKRPPTVTFKSLDKRPKISSVATTARFPPPIEDPGADHGNEAG